MKGNIIRHFPVMAHNVLQKMKSFPKGMPLKIADCNFGLGGHSRMILK
jgi:16S rRNA C1402 N4-methylase RsmH